MRYRIYQASLVDPTQFLTVGMFGKLSEANHFSFVLQQESNRPVIVHDTVTGQYDLGEGLGLRTLSAAELDTHGLS